MNWKEQFDNKFYNSRDPEAGEQLGWLGAMQNGEDFHDVIQTFISTEIIEALINEIELMVDEDSDGRKLEETAKRFGVPVSVAANRRIELKAQQLRDKWL